MKETGAISDLLSRDLASALAEINDTVASVIMWQTQVAPHSWWKVQPGFSLFSCQYSTPFARADTS
jgi:hypothetical protein